MQILGIFLVILMLLYSYAVIFLPCILVIISVIVIFLIKKRIVALTKELKDLDVNELVEKRYEKFRNM